MLLARPIPPPFLLPARGARRLYKTLQQIEAADVQNDADPEAEEGRAARRPTKKSAGRVKDMSFKGKWTFKPHIESSPRYITTFTKHFSLTSSRATRSSSSSEGRGRGKEKPARSNSSKADESLAARHWNAIHDKRMGKGNNVGKVIGTNTEPIDVGKVSTWQPINTGPKTTIKRSYTEVIDVQEPSNGRGTGQPGLKNGLATSDYDPKASSGSKSNLLFTSTNSIFQKVDKHYLKKNRNERISRKINEQVLSQDELHRLRKGYGSESNVLLAMKRYPKEVAQTKELIQQEGGQSSKKPTLSLYEELFPEEVSTPSQPRKIMIKPFEWNKGLGANPNDPFNSAKGLAAFPPVEREVLESGEYTYDVEAAQGGLQHSVVVLNGASPNLEESDFFKITPRGIHIEGWTSGIIKVIQSREALTLAPLSTYHIIFTSELAAIAYIHQTTRLHSLVSKKASTINFPTPILTFSADDDAQALIHSFSLVPASYKLEIARVIKPYPPGIAHMIRHEGPNHLISHLQPPNQNQNTTKQDTPPPSSSSSSSSSTKTLVVFALTSGVATAREIKDVLNADGRARNLLWNLAPENGIQELSVLRGEGGSSHYAQRVMKLDAAEQRSTYTTPSRFVLTFGDRFEARRFVREWHRRPFPLSGTDEEKPVVLAHYIW